MADPPDGKEEEFDFNSAGEVIDYLGLDQAQVRAMQIATESPGDYGGVNSGIRMAFEVIDTRETDDHYIITLSLRPQHEFAGRPGEEQFFIDKEGTVAYRQVLGLPRPRRAVPIVPVLIGLALVGVVAVGSVFLFGGVDDGTESEGERLISEATVPPTATPIPPTFTPPIAPSATAALPVVILPTGKTPIPTPTTVAKTSASTPQPATAAPLPTPTPMPLPTDTPVPVAPTATPKPTPTPPPTSTPPPPTATATPSLGPNACEALVRGCSMQGTIEIAGQVDWYSFDANAGDKMFIELVEGSGMDFMILELFDPQGLDVDNANSR
jgi:hypothetical protein